jgi:hypothetical protein
MLDRGVEISEAFKVMKQALATLMFYDKTHITYEEGKYWENPNLTISATYAKDFKFVITIKKEDVFTPEQIEANLKALR